MEQNEQQTPKVQITPEQARDMRQNAKMIFLTLVAVANNFRQVFADQDHEDYRDYLLSSEELAKATDRTQKRAMHRKINDVVTKYKLKNDKLTRDMLDYANGYLSSLGENTPKVMEIVDTLYLMTIELNRSKNPRQMLSVCQLYNTGFFDEAMKEMDKMKKAQQTGLTDAHGNPIAS